MGILVHVSKNEVSQTTGVLLFKVDLSQSFTFDLGEHCAIQTHYGVRRGSVQQHQFRCSQYVCFGGFRFLPAPFNDLKNH